jgi:hypothetical protein
VVAIMVETKERLQAAHGARSELGVDYDAAVAQSLVDSVERELERRRHGSALLREAGTLTIALGSIGLGVLVVTSAGDLGALGGTLAVIVAWIAIAVINVVHARRRG